ncbi:uncharacterized protein N0V89_011816 [Didymosphaeria variabile]|uniref:Uncharacterized protein n=1 Tax=Didymosphaeria variabile TaxID=1932322 RepID=A0A9W8XAS4_9PLEO|nr:uncharacterized protein N0V89_011816 [Didymosphaeria variabile]KAJ4345681.1 hypothetical protein N0V89_011816 [Didymosphaeria variabile]
MAFWGTPSTIRRIVGYVYQPVCFALIAAIATRYAPAIRQLFEAAKEQAAEITAFELVKSWSATVWSKKPLAPVRAAWMSPKIADTLDSMIRKHLGVVDGDELVAVQAAARAKAAQLSSLVDIAARLLRDLGLMLNRVCSALRAAFPGREELISAFIALTVWVSLAGFKVCAKLGLKVLTVVMLVGFMWTLIELE